MTPFQQSINFQSHLNLFNMWFRLTCHCPQNFFEREMVFSKNSQSFPDNPNHWESIKSWKVLGEEKDEIDVAVLPSLEAFHLQT